MVLFHSFLLTEVHFLYVKKRPTYQCDDDLGPLCKLSVPAKAAEKGPDSRTALRQLSPRQHWGSSPRERAGGRNWGRMGGVHTEMDTASRRAPQGHGSAGTRTGSRGSTGTYTRQLPQNIHRKLPGVFSQTFYQRTDGWVINLTGSPHERKENHHL